MGSSKPLFFFIALFGLGLWSSCEAYQFYVGGRDGWVLKPSESYGNWTQRQRFRVNDTLLFKYKKGSDSVLVVTRDDYDKCNKMNPIMKMDGGDSVFTFNRSGPFYFISGQDDNCQNGQKLVTVVLAIRSPPAASPPKSSPPSPSPVTEPPSSTSPAPSAVTPAMPPSPQTPSPDSPLAPFSPGGSSPSPSPSSSNASSSPAPAKSSSEAVTCSVLMWSVMGLFGAAVIAL